MGFEHLSKFRKKRIYNGENVLFEMFNQECFKRSFRQNLQRLSVIANGGPERG